MPPRVLRSPLRAVVPAAALLVALSACGRPAAEDHVYRTAMPLVCLTKPSGNAAGPSRPTEELTRDELLDQGRIGWVVRGVVPAAGAVNGKAGGSCRQAAYFVLQLEVQTYS